jgi:KUP system potassium uptake protein
MSQLKSAVAKKGKRNSGIPLSAGMILVTLGVVYGDIGTSPMYTMKSIVAHNGGLASVSEEMILGALCSSSGP